MCWLQKSTASYKKGKFTILKYVPMNIEVIACNNDPVKSVKEKAKLNAVPQKLRSDGRLWARSTPNKNDDFVFQIMNTDESWLRETGRIHWSYEMAI